MDDRFAPPLAQVGDAPGRSDPPPATATLAVRLMWASLALGIPSILYELGRSTSAVTGAIAFALQLAVAAFGAYIVVSVHRGKNWARIVFLLFTLLEVAFLVFGVTPPETAVVELLCNWIAGALDIAALYLLFTSPGSKWFRRSRIST